MQLHYYFHGEHLEDTASYIFDKYKYFYTKYLVADANAAANVTANVAANAVNLAANAAADAISAIGATVNQSIFLISFLPQYHLLIISLKIYSSLNVVNEGLLMVGCRLDRNDLH